jgi:voltage-gated potassium channel
MRVMYVKQWVSEERLHELYHQDTRRGIRFRYGLLIIDLVMIAFLVLSSFFQGSMVVEVVDAIIGLFILCDVLARAKLKHFSFKFFTQWHSIVDMLVVLSLLLPLAGENLAFLRALRFLRLLRSYQMMERLRIDSVFFRHNEDVVVSVVNLLLFIFFMTALVYETQHYTNPFITNYVDAMYFTVATLTTTGFGDITLQGDVGKLLSVVIMVVGVSLFIRLIQTVFRPSKVRYPCDQCGLILHDRDAVHCKHCGVVLNIPNEGTPH